MNELPTAAHSVHPRHNGSPADTARDVVAAVLYIAGALMPWNLVAGVGVPGGAPWVLALVVVATVAGMLSLLIGRPGRPNAARVRLILNLPCLALVAGVVGFAVMQFVRFGGSGEVAAGVGPGAVAAVAAALLAAQPPLDVPGYDRWFEAARRLALAAMVLAVIAFVANLFWRTRFVLPVLGDSAYGTQNLIVVATAVVYGTVALLAGLVGLRWLLDEARPGRLATVALGASTVVGTAVVWNIGVGRDIDAFHGIAQATSTASVGFEAYVAWAAAAAIVGPRTLPQAVEADRRAAMRKCLALMAIWFTGSAVLRVFDLVAATSLNMPFSTYDSVALLAFDVVAAAAAVWIRVNVSGSDLPPAVISALTGVLVVLSVCRVVVGVGLAPRILYPTGTDTLDSAVFGNTLAQQITSSFDVVMCFLALCCMAIAVRAVQRRPVPTADPAVAAPVLAAVPPPPEVWTPTERIAAPAPRIARAVAKPPDVTGKLQGPPKIARVLEESTQRFAAGTTYTGKGRGD